VSDVNAAVVLTEESPPYRCDENGVKILPGYRKPFAKGFDARRVGAYQARRNAIQARKLIADKPGIPSNLVEIQAKLSALKRAHSRCLAASVASTKGSEAAAWMRAAKDALEQLQSLLGHNTKSHKSTKKPHLAHVQPMAKVAPISTVDSGQKVSPLVNHTGLVEIHSVTPQESGNQVANPSTTQPASEQDAIEPVKAVSTISPTSTEDCPF
jgi:hypothetical protein